MHIGKTKKARKLAGLLSSIPTVWNYLYHIKNIKIMSKDKKNKIKTCDKCGKKVKNPCITFVGAHLFCPNIKKNDRQWGT